MKKAIILLVFLVFAGCLNIKAQCILTWTSTPPTCPNACNGSMTVNIPNGCTTPGTLYFNTPAPFCYDGQCGCFFQCSTTWTSNVSFPGTFVINNICDCWCYYKISYYPTFGGATFVSFPMYFSATQSISTTSSVQASCGACCDGSVSITAGGGTGPYTYTWTATGGSVVANTPNLTNACPGNYTVCVKDASGCVFCNSYSIGYVTGLNESQKDLVYQLHPNPNHGSFMLQLEALPGSPEITKAELVLINSLGQKVYEQNLSQGINNINTCGIPVGLYHYILLRDKQKIKAGKLVID